jgi:hypothetical protein
MTPFERIAKARGEVAFALARRLGVVISFSHRGAAAQSLFARVLVQALLRQDQGQIVTELRTATFEIPVQQGFPRACGNREPVTAADSISWRDRAYDVVEPIRKDPGGYVYQVKAVARKRYVSGG